MKQRLLGFLIYCFYQTLRFTWRVTLIEPDGLKDCVREKKPFILAHWHGDEIALLQLTPIYRVGTIVSQSKDGQMMDTVMKLLGAQTARGSSTRGGIGALKGLIRLARDGYPCSFAVDGPKGPIYQVKPGVFEVSKVLKSPVFWCGVACDRVWSFPRSWNKTYVPKPFARIIIQWHGPLPLLSESDDPRSLDLARRLETGLHAAKQQALASLTEH